MDEYLDYLKERVLRLENGGWGMIEKLASARAEYNRALDFARSHGLTTR